MKPNALGLAGARLRARAGGHSSAHEIQIINQLLGAVFGLDADFGRLFKNKIWNRTVSGRSTVRSMCQNIEQTRKAHGGEFNLLFKQATAGAEGVAEDIAKTVAAVGKPREFFSTIQSLTNARSIELPIPIHWFSSTRFWK